MIPIVLPIVGALLAPMPHVVPPAPITITEWSVPWEGTRPRDPYVGPDGRVWFVGQAGHYVAVFDPAAGDFRRYDLEAGTGPHNLIVDEHGVVWFTGNLRAYIGRLDPATGAIEKIPMPDPAARDPHTLAFGRPGEIWFTVQGGNFVGHLDVASRAVELVAVPTPRARPYGIKVDPDGRPWIALFGTNKLATVDPETMQLEEYALPRPDTRPRRLELASDGGLWYVDYAGGFVGRFDRRSHEVQEWRAPSAGASRPYGTALDAQDRLWFVETGPDPNVFVGFDTETHRVFSETTIESGGGTVRHMVYHQPTGTIWFGTDANTIGRAELP